MTVTYKYTYELTGEEWSMKFDKTTPLGYKMLIDKDWHELYFIMPGDWPKHKAVNAPWTVTLVPTDNNDKKYIRFLKDTGLENFFWVPCEAPPQREVLNRFASDEAVLRILKL